MRDIRTDPRRRRRRLRGLGGALLVGCLAVVAAGCGVRLDTAPPAVPTPDAAEVTRVSAVETSSTIADLAAAVTAPDEAMGAVLESVAAGSADHVVALGGVWEPPPRPTPTPTSTPSTAPPAAAEAEAVLAALVAGAEEARAQALTASEEDLALLLGSIEIWRTVAAHDVADLLGSDAADHLAGRLDRTSISLTSFPGATDLVRGVDAAAYAYEVLAARADDDAEAPWAARGRQLRDTAEAVALGSGLAESAGDPRAAAYDVAALAEVEPIATVAVLESDLTTAWLAAAGSVPEPGRTLALDAAVDAALTARSAFAAQGTSGVTAFGPLPGLAT